MTSLLIQEFESQFKSKNKLTFKVGDTVKVFSKIIEGEKERIQVFRGIVIAIKGKGISLTFSIYRNAYDCSMERVFLFHSPRITKIEIEKRGQVRKAKLYYLRGVSGKKAKVKEQIMKKDLNKETSNIVETLEEKSEEVQKQINNDLEAKKETPNTEKKKEDKE